MCLRNEIRRFEGSVSFQSIHNIWNDIASSVADIPFYLSYDYSKVAAEIAFAHGAAIEIIIVYDVFGPVAIWPFAIYAKGPFLVGKCLTCGNDEEYGRPLIRNGAREDVLASVVDALKKIHADILRIPFVETNSSLDRALALAPRGWFLPLVTPERINGYWIDYSKFATWDEFLKSISAKYWKNLRRGKRHLQAQGKLEIGWCHGASDTLVALEWLFDYKKRWAINQNLNVQWLCDDTVKDFFIKLAGRVDLSRSPFVAAMRMDGCFVAAGIAMIGSKSVELYIITYDTEFKKYSPGILLIDYLACWAYNNKLNFDFRILEYDYKSRWSNAQTEYCKSFVFLSKFGHALEIPLFISRIKYHAKKFYQLVYNDLKSARIAYLQKFDSQKQLTDGMTHMLQQNQ
ncbi:GNAT family N-acetyltransferase [Rhodovastum atsumiense]|nr:GNAT family N-acetyltransferase [Rhodovastum atsumiense]